MSMTVTASAHDVAIEIERRLPGTDEAKIHKLLYYVQGYHLAWEQGPAFSEAIEAWEMGPVVAQLWRDRKDGALSNPNEPSKVLPDSVRGITVNVICRFGDLSGADLIEATHNEDPWRNATNGGRYIAKQVISHQSLVDYFSIEPAWVSEMREKVAATRDDRGFVPDPPGALEAVIAKHFPG